MVHSRYFDVRRQRKPNAELRALPRLKSAESPLGGDCSLVGQQRRELIRSRRQRSGRWRRVAFFSPTAKPPAAPLPAGQKKHLREVGRPSPLPREPPPVAPLIDWPVVATRPRDHRADSLPTLPSPSPRTRRRTCSCCCCPFERAPAALNLASGVAQAATEPISPPKINTDAQKIRVKILTSQKKAT